METFLEYVNVDYWVLQTLAMIITAIILPGLKITGFFGPLLTVVSIALMNAHIWDAALFFQVPDSLSYHAGVLFATNGVLFWVLIKILPGIEVDGIIPALLAPVLFSAIGMGLGHLLKDINWIEVVDLIIDYLQNLKGLLTEQAPTGAVVPESVPAHDPPTP